MIDTTCIRKPGKRVAAYICSSPRRDSMMHGLMDQMNGYIDRIMNTTGWSYAGVYADSDREGRPKFQQLLADCENGDIDLILVRDIPTLGLQPERLVRLISELSVKGIGIQFEDEGLNTLDDNGLSEDGSTMVAVFKAFSPKKVEKPKPRHFGFDPSGATLEEEAETIRGIFDLFIVGLGRMPIARILNDEGTAPPPGKHAWTYVDIRHILSDPAYDGTIIDTELYAKAVAENAKRTNTYGYRQPCDNPLSGLIRCGICGNTFTRRERGKSSMWLCRTYLKHGREACPSRCILERKLLSLIDEIPGGLDALENVTVYPDNRLVITADDNDFEKEWK